MTADKFAAEENRAISEAHAAAKAAHWRAVEARERWEEFARFERSRRESGIFEELRADADDAEREAKIVLAEELSLRESSRED